MVAVSAVFILVSNFVVYVIVVLLIVVILVFNFVVYVIVVLLIVCPTSEADPPAIAA